MIRFKTVKFRNLGSFGNTDTVINIERHRTTLVSGMNGHGKSFALLDSITFALFGKPFRKINIPQLVNSINDKDCLVELEFSIGQTEYTIRRGIKPKIFEIIKDGNLLDQDSKAKDYQKMLEEQILKMNYKSFTQVVILGSTSFIPFMQLSAQDRREVIEDVLDIQMFSKMNTVLKNKVSQKKEELRETENTLVILRDKIKVLKEHIVSLKQEDETKIKELLDDIETTDILIEKKEQTINFLLKNQGKLSSQIHEMESHKSKLSKLDNMRKIITNSGKKSEEKINLFESSDECPTCTQNISETTRTAILDNVIRKKKDYEKGIKQIEKEIEKLQNELSDFRKISLEITELNESIMGERSSVESSKKYISKIKEHIASLSNKSGGGEMNDIQESINKLNADESDILSKKKELHLDGVLLGCAGNLLKDTGIKSKIIRHYLPVMNKLINKYLTDMGFFAQFNLDENFNETIKSRHRDQFTYMSFSEGEKMRIDLALLLAWREIARLKNSANTNLLILDEVFDSSLDSVGTEEFLKLMSVLSASTHVFVVSHKSDQLIDKFDNQITFVKKGNFSRLQ